MRGGCSGTAEGNRATPAKAAAPTTLWRCMVGFPPVVRRGPSGKAPRGYDLEAPAFVAGLDDVAVMGEAVEQRGGHFRIAEHARPFAEGEIGGDDDRSSLVEPADEIQQLPAGLSEGEIAEFVEDDEVEAREVIGEPSLAAARDSASSWLTRSTVVKKRLSIGTQKGTPYRRPKGTSFVAHYE